MAKMKRNKTNFFLDPVSRRCILLLLVLIPSAALFAQSANTNGGSIQILRDAKVDTLVNRYTRVKQREGSIMGYRIQIAAGTNRNNVYQTKSQFYNAFPEIKQYLIYQAPNFKLRVGNYRTRLEAFKDLQEILREFNGAFIIRDELKISEL